MSFSLSTCDIFKRIQCDLDPWAKDRRGYVSIAGDPGELIEMLADKPAGFRVVLSFTGDDDQTGQELAGIVTNTFDFWLIKAKGLQLKPGENLINGDPPFLQLLTDLRARIRSMVFPAGVTNERFLYKGCKQFEPELAAQLPTVGYKLTFELIASVPEEKERNV